MPLVNIITDNRITVQSLRRIPLLPPSGSDVTPSRLTSSVTIRGVDVRPCVFVPAHRRLSKHDHVAYFNYNVTPPSRDTPRDGPCGIPSAANTSSIKHLNVQYSDDPGKHSIHRGLDRNIVLSPTRRLIVVNSLAERNVVVRYRPAIIHYLCATT